jgi:hypothetical protein
LQDEAMRPANSARTTWAIATSTCPGCMALTSTGTYTTSMPRSSQKCRTIRKTQRSAPSLDRNRIFVRFSIPTLFFSGGHNEPPMEDPCA